MKIKYHKQFQKSYKRRIRPHKQLAQKFEDRLRLFLVDPKNSLLKDHQLFGEKRNYRAFSVNGDVRVVYRIMDGKILLFDIGSHNQVY